MLPDTARMAALGITHDQLTGALRGFAANTSGGFLELGGREYLIRHLGRTSRLEDLQNLALTAKTARACCCARWQTRLCRSHQTRRRRASKGRAPSSWASRSSPTADTIGLTAASRPRWWT